VKLLLDTCAFIWLADISKLLSSAAREAILRPENQIYFSSVSAWELCRNYSKGSLKLPLHPEQLIRRVRDDAKIETIVFTEEEAITAEKLPLHHRDPFDRMIIAQALVNGMTILTSDDAFGAYPVRVLW